MARNGRKTSIYHFLNSQKNIFAFCVISIDPIEVQTCSAPQNDRLNLSFVKNIYVVGKKMARNGRKSAIYNSPFLCISLCIKLTNPILFPALTEPSIDYGFHRLGKLVPRHPGDPEKLPKEIVLKRAADLAEALYSMPRNNQLALSAAGSPRSPSAISASAQQAAAMHAGFNSYSGQLAVSVQENAVANGQWAEGM